MKRKICFVISLLIVIVGITGCSTDVAVINIQNNTNGRISKTAAYWSGVSKETIEIVNNESREISFDINMEKGSVTFILENMDGEEVYTLTRDGECIVTETFTFTEEGKYILNQKGDKFSGKYKITWNDEKGELEEESKDNNM